MGKLQDNYLVQAWLVITLALLFGAALAGMDTAVAGRIQQNMLNETVAQIPSLVPGATGGEEMALGEKAVYRAMDAEGQQVGWVVPAYGQGFADRIDLLIGLNNQADTITGLYVLAQKETPGLGNKIIEEPWRSQFAGKKTQPPMTVTKSDPEGPDQIKAVTGATVSSQSVTDIVNNTVAKLRSPLAAAAK